MSDYQRLRQNEDDETQETTLGVYITYKRRWFYLFIVCLAQISNAMVNQIDFVRLIKYFRIDLDKFLTDC